MAQSLVTMGGPCYTCRKFGIDSQMSVYSNGYYCETCKTFRSGREKARNGIADNLRIAGFFLLLMATFVLSRSMVFTELEWLALLAGYSFYFLTFFQQAKDVLNHG